MSTPLISYINVLQEATLTASSETADGLALNAVDGLTYDYWVPTSAANIEFQLPGTRTVECFAVAAHTLATDGAGVWLEYWDGTAWVEISRPAIASTDVTAFDTFAPVTASLFRVSVSAGCSVGVLWAGPIMTMQRGIYQGHTPVTIAERGEQRANQTETGEWRGVAVTVKGAELSASFKNLTGQWVRNTFAPFVSHVNEGKPFFWAWYIDKYPKEVAYCWHDGDLQVTNTGPRDFMGATITGSAYIDGPPPPTPIVTSTPYPVYSLENAAGEGVVDSGATIRQRTLETAQATGVGSVSAVLDNVLITYSNGLPETTQATGVNSVTADLNSVLVTYSNGLPETTQATGVGTVSATLDEILITYSNGLPEKTQANGVTSVGATLT